MSTYFQYIIPNAEDVLALEPEELAGAVLEMFNRTPNYKYSRHNFGLIHTVAGYPQQYHEPVLRALMEAWMWLEREGMIAPIPAEEGMYFVTRRGKQIKKAADLDSYRRADMLPKKLLHPAIAQKVWATFLRGDYDTAVFQAFKEVEVAVRNAGSFAAEDIGITLMRKAFDPAKGPLTDTSLPQSEKEALAHLFAGAIGSYKNPHSHRTVSITDQTEAVEMIILASHLLKIVDSRVT